MPQNRLRSIVRTAAVAGITVLTMGAQWCPPVEQIAKTLALTYSNDLDDRLGFAVYVEPKIFPAGTRFAADIPGADPASPGREWHCQNRCMLLMLDLNPRAHFSHPVILATFDIVTKDLDPDLAQWWPFDPRTGERYFHTEAARRKAAKYCSNGDCGSLFPKPHPTIELIERTQLAPMFMMGTPGPTPPPRTVWAVVINGYDDPDDTFDNDTDGMVQVLKGMGVPNNHICYLSDAAGPAGDIDAKAQISTVEGTMSYLRDLLDNDPTTNSGGAPCGLIIESTPDCSELLFFISTHGYANSLSCNHTKPGGGAIGKGDLLQWVDNINCTNKTIVIEACKSGTFLPNFGGPTPGGTPVPSFFVSAGPTTDSYQDLDPYCEPNETPCDTTNPLKHDPNPGDAGSEVVWGFIEAFGTSGADIPPKDGRISFAEAVKYAIDNNASPATPDSYSGMATPWFPFLSSFDPLPTTLSITDGPATPATVQNPAGLVVSKIERGRFNTLHVEAENTGPQPLAVGTLRMHSTGPSNAPPMPSDHALTMIIPGIPQGAKATFEINWCADADLNKGDELIFHASLDSPQSPSSTNPNDQVKEKPALVVNPSIGVIPSGCGCRSACGGQ